MMKRATAHEKNPCCRPEQKRPSLFNEKNLDSRAEESSLPAMSAPLFRCNLMDLPVQPPGQAKSAGPVVQRYVKVGLYEGSLGLDHIGVGVNSEKTKGFSPRAGQSREAERGAWVQGEVREDHDQIESLTIRTSPSQEARLKAALNRSESSSQKFNLSQHNCAQHGAQILKSAGLSVKSSPLPRAFFEGLKRQYASGQREAAGDREPVQGRFESHACPEPGQEAPRPNRTGMPDRLKAGIESLSGIDMSDVRVHANSDRPAKLDALAYTQGSQIYLGPGQERHLAHEAWHAVQQKQGRVRATGQVKPAMHANGVSINADLALEREADTIGSKALQIGRGDQFGTGSMSWTSTSLQRIQRTASPFPGLEKNSGMSMLPRLCDAQPDALCGLGPVQRQIDRALALEERGLPPELRLNIEQYNLDFGDREPGPVANQMQALNTIERTIYAWYNAQDTYNFGVANDPMLATYRALEAETQREREAAVDRAPADNAPVDRTHLNEADRKRVDAVWADLVKGTGYLKIEGDAAFKRKIRAMLVRILDTPPGRQLLTTIATGSKRKREVTIGGNTPPAAMKELLLEKSPRESMSNPQIYSGWFNKWWTGNTPAKQLAMSLTRMQPVDDPGDPEHFYPMSVPGDMMHALASDKIGVVVTRADGLQYFKFGQGAHAAYVALIDNADGTDNRDAAGKAVHTPAFVTLAHELGHALNQLSGSATLDEDGLLALFSGTTVEGLGTPENPGTVRKQWTNMEEMVTILGFEKAIRNAVGLKERGGHAAAIDPDIVAGLSISKQATPWIMLLVGRLAELDAHAEQNIQLRNYRVEAFELNSRPVKGISMQEKVQRIGAFSNLFDTQINGLIISSATLAANARENWRSYAFPEDFKITFIKFFPNLGATLY